MKCSAWPWAQAPEWVQGVFTERPVLCLWGPGSSAKAAVKAVRRACFLLVQAELTEGAGRARREMGLGTRLLPPARPLLPSHIWGAQLTLPHGHGHHRGGRGHSG